MDSCVFVSFDDVRGWRPLAWACRANCDIRHLRNAVPSSKINIKCLVSCGSSGFCGARGDPGLISESYSERSSELVRKDSHFCWLCSHSEVFAVRMGSFLTSSATPDWPGTVPGPRVGEFTTERKRRWASPRRPRPNGRNARTRHLRRAVAAARAPVQNSPPPRAPRTAGPGCP